MLQIRLSLPDFASGVSFSDPIIIENADSISLTKTVNSSDEKLTFTIATNDPKFIYVNYLRWWECWDTSTNERLNYGPIDSIDDTQNPVVISGPGRSHVLAEFFKTLQTFYYPISTFFTDLTYENIAGEPRTKTIISSGSPRSEGSGLALYRHRYHGLSNRTKDNAIDEQTGFIAPGKDSPIQNVIKTDSYWSGTWKSDYIIIDLGDNFTISKARILLPWWGGMTPSANRAYDWRLLSSTNNSSYTSRYSTGSNNDVVTAPPRGQEITLSNIAARYWKIDITDTHAWRGSVYEDNVTDEWDWECGGTDTLKGSHRESPTDGTINNKSLTPNNDCHASVVEVDLSRKILDIDEITPLVLTQIESSNRQITYYHEPTTGEMITTDDADVRKFEPGQPFRRVIFHGSGSVQIYDEWNNKVYDGDADGQVRLSAYNRELRFEGSSDVHVTYVDCWRGKSDPLSYGGEYSFTTIAGDYARLHFRGQSVKWWATVPTGSTAASVRISLREQASNGTWGSWGTLESAYTLSTGVSASNVYEVTYESELLDADTTYELQITNLNGGYLSIDAFTGYWSASFEDINEDDVRFHLNPVLFTQLYDGQYSRGTIYKYNSTRGKPVESFGFTGDRVVLYVDVGPKHGSFSLALLKSGGGYGDNSRIVSIPGGDADGRLTIDTKSSKHVPQSVVFDSDEYFDDLPWGSYAFFIYKNTLDGPIYIDGIGVHTTQGLSAKFVETQNLEVLKNTTEIMQVEWDVTENGLKVVPRIGDDTWVIFKEGTQTTVNIEEIKDVSKVATMLRISGSDIDGLPLTAVVEDRNTRKAIGRTIQQQYDLRNVGSYFALIGAGRTELKKRNVPEERITVNTVDMQGIELGDSFLVKKGNTELRARLKTLTRNQSKDSGTTYVLECEKKDPLRTTVTTKKVKPTVARYGVAQAAALILSSKKIASGQAQAKIKGIERNKSGQAKADIKQVVKWSAQAQADIKVTTRGYGQSQGQIVVPRNQFGQAQADISQTYRGFGQSQASTLTKGYASSQSAALIPSFISLTTTARHPDSSSLDFPSGATLTIISFSYSNTLNGVGSDIQIEAREAAFQPLSTDGSLTRLVTGSPYDTQYDNPVSTRETDIGYSGAKFKNSTGSTKQVYVHGDWNPEFGTGATWTMRMDYIIDVPHGSGQAQAYMKGITSNFGQAQADIKATSRGCAQAQAKIGTIGGDDSFLGAPLGSPLG